MAFCSACFSAVPDIYPAAEQASVDLAAALHNAAATHRRVIVDFGGNWRLDCHVLDDYFHDVVNPPILAAHFAIVPFNGGAYDQNLAAVKRFAVPLKSGVCALAILDGKGKLLHAQQGGEFQAMPRMQSGAVMQFLHRWTVPAP